MHHTAVARKIQRAYRSHLTTRRKTASKLTHLTSLTTRLETLTFTSRTAALTCHLRFNEETGTLALGVKENMPLIAYEEGLTRLLIEADEVESGGNAEVREKRREVIKMVQKELDDVDRRKKDAWKEVKEGKEKAAEAEATVTDGVKDEGMDGVAQSEGVKGEGMKDEGMDGVAVGESEGMDGELAGAMDEVKLGTEPGDNSGTDSQPVPEDSSNDQQQPTTTTDTPPDTQDPTPMVEDSTQDHHPEPTPMVVDKPDHPTRTDSGLDIHPADPASPSAMAIDPDPPREIPLPDNDAAVTTETAGTATAGDNVTEESTPGDQTPPTVEETKPSDPTPTSADGTSPSPLLDGFVNVPDSEGILYDGGPPA
ncbi:hypothetical protein HK104_011305 [Borealophlyctis nickersoniae]|nr:hypothetical protein HK104_011305 [Borealophlyctis nickersoniae]